MGKRALLFFAVAVLALGAGMFFGWQAKAPAVAEADAQALFAANIPDLNGQNQDLAQWRGKVLVVNFWATWCPPCREEIPQFVKIQDKYRDRGLVFVGVALDKKDAVEAYIKEVGINYPVLLGDLDAMELSRKAGNRAGALPFTAILDRKGKIVSTQLGGLTQAKLDAIITPLL
ncbi:MAG TPA: redoxin family protein [Burkholderiales bacterium]|nr:redoxin family protein [Burkholderiales bacterium]